jgi:hypothetical protein
MKTIKLNSTHSDYEKIKKQNSPGWIYIKNSLDITMTVLMVDKPN